MGEFRECWERLPGESGKAYAAFCIYRDDGTTRSYAKVAKKLGKSKTLIERWGRVWSWVERAGSWGEELDRQVRAEQVQARRDMVERHVTMAKALQGKVGARLLTMLKPEDLRVEDVPRWLEVAVRVERLALGQPTEIAVPWSDGQGQGSVDNELELARRIAADPEASHAAHVLLGFLAGEPGEPGGQGPAGDMAASQAPAPPLGETGGSGDGTDKAADSEHAGPAR